MRNGAHLMAYIQLQVHHCMTILFLTGLAKDLGDAILRYMLADAIRERRRAERVLVNHRTTPNHVWCRATR